MAFSRTISSIPALEGTRVHFTGLTHLLSSCTAYQFHHLSKNLPIQPKSSIISADEEIINRVEVVAKKKGWQVSHVALVWLKSKGTVPIVGCNSVEKIEDVCGLLGKNLTDEEVRYLDEPYVPKPVAGHF